jgi:hypothetical protein
LADTRGIQQDELHKRSIATQIKDHIDSVTAVLILANGTVPRITVGTDYALSTLSAIFPKTLADNIAFMFTNVPSPLSWNFSQNTVPEALKHAPQYLLDNPIALQKKYLKLTNGQNKTDFKELHKTVRIREQNALERLAKLFDWLDGLEPQPKTGILSLYEIYKIIEINISNALTQKAQAAATMVKVNELVTTFKQNSNVSFSPCLRLALQSYAHCMQYVDAFAKFTETVEIHVWKQQSTVTWNMVCGQTGCYSNCHMDCKRRSGFNLERLFGCKVMNKVIKRKTCGMCRHSFSNHHHYCVEWQQIREEQVSVNEDMKKKWKEAKGVAEKTAALIEAREKARIELDQVVSKTTNDLVRLAEEFAGLSLSGSYSVQVDKVVKLLEHSYETMQEGVDRQAIKESLDSARMKLKLFKEMK